MSDETGAEAPEVPEGAAVFPFIPPELGVNPLLLAVLHSLVFLTGSDEALVNPIATEEAVQYMAGYLQRLEGEMLRRTREDMACLAAYARGEKWPRQLLLFLKTFLADYGVGPEGEK